MITFIVTIAFILFCIAIIDEWTMDNWHRKQAIQRRKKYEANDKALHEAWLKRQAR